MLETTYILRLGQLLKITPNFKKCTWHKLKPKKPNIISKVILEPRVAIVVETHFEIDTTIIEVNN
jgi:hypothetical protein